MVNFNLINILCFCSFVIFIYYQQMHAKDFNGESKIFQLILNLFALLGTIIGLIFLIYYGVNVVWWAPFVLILISILILPIGMFFEKLIGNLILSLIGFIAWPILAYIMFITIPRL